VLPWTGLDNATFDERIQMAVISNGLDLPMEGQETGRHLLQEALQIRTMALPDQFSLPDRS